MKKIIAITLMSSILLSCNQKENSETNSSNEDIKVTESKKIIVPESDKQLITSANGFFKSISNKPLDSKDNPITKEKIALGKKLFFEPRLSLSGVISCNSCHNLASYGVDNLSVSFGHKFATGDRNSPTVLNSSLNLAQFWDGRAKNLEEQAKGPVLNPVEMAVPHEDFAVKRISSIPGYVKDFKEVYPSDENPVTYDNIANSIATFEKTLLTPSRFDKYLNGDYKALNENEKTGLKTFISKGCIACHNGAGIGGGMYQKFGLIEPYIHQKDLGRFNHTSKEEDKYFFKVPTLRNITKTYPYFHDGKVWDIKEAVRIMGRSQLGLKLNDLEVDSIVAFLDSLTGDLSSESRTLPILPSSSLTTEKPRV